VPAEVPPHDPVYHCQLAPDPSVPPVTPNVVEPARQTESLLAVIPLGTEDKRMSRTLMLPQLLVLQVPSARTK